MRPFLATSAFLADPGGSSPLSAAARWIEGTLLGTAGTVVAVLCVASVGFLMLSGRVDLRRGIAVVIGCFILFGAQTIAQGLLGLAQPEAAPPPSAPPPNGPQMQFPAEHPPPYDPYAGASVNRR